MLRRRFVALIPVLTLAVGCGDDNAPAEGVDHDAAYALEIKAKSLEFVDQWHKNPEAAKGLIDGLTEQLAAFESMPLGKHKDTFQQLRDATQKVHANYAQATPDQINRIKAVAEGLPGEASQVKLYE